MRTNPLAPLGCMAFTIWFLVVIGVIYVVLHFLIKYW
jgi:hypothetical protein